MSEKLLLEGLKVIDAGSFIAGPVSTTILSDFGAEVIKIEPPKIGDSLRHLITRTKRVNPISDKDYCWHLTSRNKKSFKLYIIWSRLGKIIYFSIPKSSKYEKVTKHLREKKSYYGLTKRKRFSKREAS